MAFDVNEVWRGESLNQSAGGTRKYVRKVQMLADNSSETFSTARTAFLAFLGGSTHPDDASAYMTDFSIDRDDDSREVWYAQADYEFSLQDPGEDPTTRDPVIRATSSLIIKPVVRDLNGYACVNSAGDYFDPPLEAEFARWTYTIQWNASTIPVGIGQFRGAVNNASITIEGETYVAGRARIIGLDIGEQDEENGVPFRSITIVVECREADDDGFDLEPLDQGFRILDTIESTGILTTRTNDTVGTLTMSSGHGITTGKRFTITWDGGSRRGVKAGTVSGTSVPFTLGTGDILPFSATAVETAVAGNLVDILIEDEDSNKARPSAPVLLNGRGQKLDATVTPGVFLKYIVTRKLDLTVFPGIT